MVLAYGRSVFAAANGIRICGYAAYVRKVYDLPKRALIVWGYAPTAAQPRSFECLDGGA
ncbi:MAG: hypothetical protein LC775_15020 [Acidobacteria bacterium]|nr:hypothetical protein [Acidobacteriota bacterium]